MEVRKRERWAEHIRAEKVAEEEEEPTEGGEGSGSKTGKRAVDEPANIPLCVDLDGTLVYYRHIVGECCQAAAEPAVDGLLLSLMADSGQSPFQGRDCLKGEFRS